MGDQDFVSEGKDQPQKENGGDKEGVDFGVEGKSGKSGGCDYEVNKWDTGIF